MCIGLWYVKEVITYRKLLHQYIVDIYPKIKYKRFLFIKTYQKDLGVANYIHLRDFLTNDHHIANIRQLTILPATFTGEPQCMHVIIDDMADLFITYLKSEMVKDCE